MKMEIPNGFILDPASGLYFQETRGPDPQTGATARLVTWYDPSANSYRQCAYPLTEGLSALPIETPRQTSPPSPPRKSKKWGPFLAMGIGAGVLAMAVLYWGWSVGWFYSAPSTTVIELAGAEGVGIVKAESPTGQESMPTPAPVPKTQAEKAPPVDTGVRVGGSFQVHLSVDGTFTCAASYDGEEITGSGRYVVTAENYIVLLPAEEFAGVTGEIWFNYTMGPGLELASPKKVANLKKGDALVNYLREEPAAAADFPYLGTFTCRPVDRDDPGEVEPAYRPYIVFYEDGTFFMYLNLGEGLADSTGSYSWDESAGMIYLTFEQVDVIRGSGRVGEYAEMQIVDEDTLHFLTESFGVMWSGNSFGLFRRD